jgi:hypothetical protein
MIVFPLHDAENRLWAQRRIQAELARLDLGFLQDRRQAHEWRAAIKGPSPDGEFPKRHESNIWPATSSVLEPSGS